MTTTNRMPSRRAQGSRAERRDLNRAWIALAMVPVGFIAAFAVGEGIYALLGYKPEDATEPLWVDLVAGVPAIILFLLPCVAAVVYGNRARAEGRRAGFVPLVAGAVLGLWMVLITVASFVAG